MRVSSPLVLVLGAALSAALTSGCNSNPAAEAGDGKAPTDAKSTAHGEHGGQGEHAEQAENESSDAPSTTADAKGSEGGETGDVEPDPHGDVVIEAVGIEACDVYIESWHKCVQEHAPGDKEPHLAALREQVGTWKQSKGGGGENALRALPIGCKAAEAAAKQASAEWGCEW